LKKEGKRRAVSLSFFVVGRFEGEARQKVIEREFFFFFFFFVLFFFPSRERKAEIALQPVVVLPVPSLTSTRALEREREAEQNLSFVRSLLRPHHFSYYT